MIKYQLDENGKAINFSYQKDSISLEDGWLSIPGDRIPEDITQYHEQRYVDSQTLESQKAQCQQLLNDSDKKMASDTPYQDDIPAWTAVRTQWRTIIKSNQIETIPEPPF